MAQGQVSLLFGQLSRESCYLVSLVSPILSHHFMIIRYQEILRATSPTYIFKMALHLVHDGLLDYTFPSLQGITPATPMPLLEEQFSDEHAFPTPKALDHTPSQQMDRFPPANNTTEVLDLSHPSASQQAISLRNATLSPFLRLPAEIKDRIFS